MVEVEELESEDVAPWAHDERILDAEAIEEAARNMTRVSARLHLEALAKKLRKESEALKRVEASQAKVAAQEQQRAAKEAKLREEEMKTSKKEEEKREGERPTAGEAPQKKPTVSAAGPPPLSGGTKYVPISKFSFDFGDFKSAFVSIYIDLPNVGSIPKDQITCDFRKDAFDFIVKDLEGKSYRLLKTDLEKEIVPEKSKRIVKADKVVIKLAKKKGEYGSYDYWTKLTDSKKKSKDKKSGSDPTGNLMDMMKDLYDSGDDKMKKMIGETMMKQKTGQLDKEMPDFNDDI